MTPHGLKKLEHFLPRSNSASVVTYAREGDQVMKFIQAIFRATRDTTTTSDSPAAESTAAGSTAAGSPDLSRKIDQLPYSATETTLGDEGFERITRSSFGQFATLVPLLFPER